MFDAETKLKFKDREQFRKWLQTNHDKSKGIWILFQKGKKTFTAEDALEEAICHGWIDGLIKSVDERTYKKYFSRRKNTEKWSEKNIRTFKRLKETGLVTQAGLSAFRAQENRKKPDNNTQNNRNMEVLCEVLKRDTEAFRIFEEVSPSRKKQMAGFYCEAKTEETRRKRIQKIAEALKKNYKGMLY